MGDGVGNELTMGAEAHIKVTFALKDIYRMAYGEEARDMLPGAIIDAVAKETVRRLAEDREGYRSLRDNINRVRDEIVREVVTPVVETALANPFQKTNTYGEPDGEQTTLRELIVAEAHKVIAAPADRYDSRKETALQRLVRTEVNTVFERELKEAVDEAKDQVRAAVQEKASVILAKTIQEMGKE